MDFVFKSENSEQFWKGWNRYTSNHPASYRYLPTYLSYTTQYSSNIIADKSFVLYRGGDVVGVCPLYIETVQGRRMISNSGGFAAAPLSHDEKAEKVLFQKIDEIGREYDVSAIKMFLDPLLNREYGNFNILRRYGFLDVSSSNALIDLSKEESLLWQGLRKSYKPLINGVLKDPEFKIDFFDRSSADYEVHENYRRLHHKCAGRVTRPKETFDKQFQLLQEGNSLLAGLRHKGTWVAFNYFVFVQDKAIYFSTADDPDFTEKRDSVYHAVLWSSMLGLKKRGIRYLELSQPSSFGEVEGFLDYSDRKQIDIGLYKRGMSAEMIPVFRGIKYFDVELFNQECDVFKLNMHNQIEKLRNT